ncbi:MAG: transposase [Planctomycetia bacterium]|nr:transposase [Planctomycetia bacterium]
MQRRVHSTYARHTAQVSFGLVAGGIGCLVGGLIAKSFGLHDLVTVMNVAFAVFAIALAIRWFSAGETTTCPKCGSALTADKVRTRRLGLTFRCRPCNILWLTQPEPGALEQTEDDPADEAEDHDPDADGYNGEELVDNHDPFAPAAHDEAERKE